MKSIEDHIEHDKKIADDPQANPAARRHAKDELHELEEYVEHIRKRLKQAIIMIQMPLHYFVTIIQTNLSV